MTKTKKRVSRPKPRPRPKSGPYRYGRLLALLAMLPLLGGCASFAHGIVAEKAAVMASFDDVQARVDQTYGVTIGAPVSVGLALCRFGTVVGLAGMSGVAHIPTDIASLTGQPCPYCAAEALKAQATTRPASP